MGSNNYQCNAVEVSGAKILYQVYYSVSTLMQISEYKWMYIDTLIFYVHDTQYL